jgi:hypothetical protein
MPPAAAIYDVSHCEVGCRPAGAMPAPETWGVPGSWSSVRRAARGGVRGLGGFATAAAAYHSRAQGSSFGWEETDRPGDPRKWPSVGGGELC